jgi:hypothetical protein
MAKDRPDPTGDEDENRIGGGPGAGDAYSGAGNATGVPDADTGMRTGDVTNRGDVDEDREKLFPDAVAQTPHPGEQNEIDEDRDVDHAE